MLKTTHICKHEFCPIIQPSITTLWHGDARKGRNEPPLHAQHQPAALVDRDSVADIAIAQDHAVPDGEDTKVYTDVNRVEPLLCGQKWLRGKIIDQAAVLIGYMRRHVVESHLTRIGTHHHRAHYRFDAAIAAS